MPDSSLLDRLTGLPRAYDPRRVENGRLDLEKEVAALADDQERMRAGEVLLGDACGPLLGALFGNSPYLGRLILRAPDVAGQLVSEPPDLSRDRLLARTLDLGKADLSEAELMASLRRAKREVALLTAIADIGNAWNLETVTGTLTDFADAALEACVQHLFRAAIARGTIVAEIETFDPADSGYIVLGMGKYGAGELNYSSDIDLVVFYERDLLTFKDGTDPGRTFVNLTRSLVKLMQEITSDGYVFRVDLRLRPDPGATQVAVSVEAAEQYYEAFGQNWERSAFIKARPVAGDITRGEQFLRHLRPFIWRKHLDYASIEDIHSMKRKIHAHEGHAKVVIPGHNIKLGRGGIREIEFFVQAQQLIAGGRNPDLRGRTTCGVLERMQAHQLIDPEVRSDLENAYYFLRQLEHRLQMVADEQTHTLPSANDGLDQIATFAGYETREQFDGALEATLRTVERHYARLFEQEPEPANGPRAFDFTGTDDNPETIRALEELGFDRAAGVAAAIRSWKSGRVAATRSERSRKILRELTPALLEALSHTADPTTAFLRFDTFLAGLPAGVQLFSMFRANPHLLTLMASVLGTAPRLANQLSQNPRLLEGVLQPGFFAVLPDRAHLAESLDRALEPAQDLLDTLELGRIWANEHRFRVGVRVLSGSAESDEAGPAYATLASVIIEGLLPVVLDEMAQRHGRIEGGRMSVLGMGKFGGLEMTASSDLDLIVIYDADDMNRPSDGPKPIYPGQYFTRVTQRLISALTVQTSEGGLYEVDLRLRPSGRAGPLATQLASFVRYQASEAWTWEHMALTRARFVAGDASLEPEIQQAIAGTLRVERDTAAVARSVAEMRSKLAVEFGDSDRWELKYAAGGLIDLEFTAQYLQLVHAHRQPDVLSYRTREVFARAGTLGLIEPQMADELLAAIGFLHNLTQVLKICVEGRFKPEEATGDLRRRLARAGGTPDFDALEQKLVATQQRVRALFQELVLSSAA